MEPPYPSKSVNKSRLSISISAAKLASLQAKLTNVPPSAIPRNTLVTIICPYVFMNADPNATAPNAITRYATQIEPTCLRARFDGTSTTVNC